MSSLKVGLAAAMSFVLGAALFRTPTVKANPQKTELAHVFIVPVAVLDAKAPSSTNLPGARIAGISCIPKPEKRLPDAAVCYVATTLN